MQSEVFTNAQILVSTSTALGTRDLSNRTMKIELSRQKDDHDDTVMGNTAHTYIMGLEKWSFKTDMIQSFSTSDGGENTNNILDTLFNLPSNSQKFLVTVRKTLGTARGPSNPEWNGLCVLAGFSPITGGVGDLLKSSVEFKGSSNLTLVTSSS